MFSLFFLNEIKMSLKSFEALNSYRKLLNVQNGIKFQL